MNKTIHKLLGHKGVRPHCALLLAILMIVGCTNDEFMQQQTPGSQDGESIPFTATISGKAATRAITENTTDKTLVTSWAVNEEVALVHYDVMDKMTVSAIDPTTDATNQNVTWESSKPAVASVDQNGKVTAQAEGEATITVTTNDGSKQATCTVKVNLLPSPTITDSDDYTPGENPFLMFF